MRFTVFAILISSFIFLDQAHAKLPDEFNSLWIRVAKADSIVVAILDVPESEIRASITEQNYRYVTITAAPLRFLKGEEVAKQIEIQHYAQDAFYTVNNKQLFGIAQKKMIVFMVEADEKYYFIQTGESALEAVSKEKLASIETEVREQENILHDWRPDPSIPHFKAVKQLILKAKSSESQAAAFEALEALGSSAVPAIIAQMDDFTPLEENYIALKNNGPGAFEEYRQYGPEVMADALAAILNQLTGISFGSIANGASDKERKSAIDGWRIYGMKHSAYSNTRPSKPQIQN